MIRAWILSLGMAFLCAGAPSWGAPAPQAKLTLDAFLDRARERDVEFQRILNEQVPAKYWRALNLPSPQVLLELGNEHGFQAGGTNTSSLSAGAEKDFPSTGTSVSLSFGKNDRPDRNETTAQLRVTQSLYRNAFGSMVRELEEKLDLETRAQLLRATELYEDYVARLTTRYLDWTLAYLGYKAASQMYDDALTLQGNIERRLRKSVALPIDVDRARVQTMERRETMLGLQAELEAQTQAIAQVIERNAGVELVPTYEFDLDTAKTDLSKDVGALLKATRSMRMYELQEQAAVRGVEVKESELDPDLRLVTGYNIDNSTRFQTSVNRNEALVGLQLSVPLGDSRAQAGVQQAVYEKKKAELERRVFERDTRAALIGLREKIAHKRAQVKVSREKLLLSDRIVKAEKQRYEQGRITLETLILAQNALAQNHSTYLSNRIDLNKDIVEWLRLVDQLVDNVP